MFRYFLVQPFTEKGRILAVDQNFLGSSFYGFQIMERMPQDELGPMGPDVTNPSPGRPGHDEKKEPPLQ